MNSLGPICLFLEKYDIILCVNFSFYHVLAAMKKCYRMIL